RATTKPSSGHAPKPPKSSPPPTWKLPPCSTCPNATPSNRPSLSPPSHPGCNVTLVGCSSLIMPMTSPCFDPSCPQGLVVTSSSPLALTLCKGWPSASTLTSFLLSKVPR